MEELHCVADELRAQFQDHIPHVSPLTGAEAVPYFDAPGDREAFA